jgi:hypothetical protein
LQNFIRKRRYKGFFGKNVILDFPFLCICFFMERRIQSFINQGLAAEL